jgi:aromatic-L-amino-acid/L-tryptophan decarboxylase
MNMHKWLLTNFDVSCLYVQERKHLINAFSLTHSYVKNAASDSGLVFDYRYPLNPPSPALTRGRDWQIPFGRRFRSLKVWFVMRSYGLEGMQAHIRKTVNLGRLFADLLRSRPDLFDIFVEPAFALTCFTVNGPEGTTKRVYQTLETEKRIFPSSAVVEGTFVIRVVSGLPALEEKDIREAFEIVVEAAERVVKEVN